MPYHTNQDLPSSLQERLPEHAQTIFRKAFNASYVEYGDDVIAFKVAWAAVKKQYVKQGDGFWAKKDEK